MKIKDLLEIVDYNFEAAGKHLWNCYGDDAFFIDFKTTDGEPIAAGAIININGDVFEAHFSLLDECYDWINPAYRDAYENEAAKITTYVKTDVKHIMLEVAEDFIEKFDAFIHGREFDKNVVVPISLTVEEELELHRQAHAARMSTNDYINFILTDAVDKLKAAKKKKKKKKKIKW